MHMGLNMAQECKWLLSCTFFQSSTSGNEKIEKLKGIYCKGDLQNQCLRKIYKEFHGYHADPNIGPEGKLIDSDD